MSTNCSVLLRNFTLNNPSSTCSLIQCHFLLICLSRWWNSGLYTVLTAPSLSQYIGVFLTSTPRKSSTKHPSHTGFVPPRQAAINSASVVKRATTGCFLLDHTTGPLLRKKMHPDVDLQSLMSPEKSESTYPVSSFSSPPIRMPYSLVALR